jgi:hypothetical protein
MVKLLRNWFYDKKTDLDKLKIRKKVMRFRSFFCTQQLDKLALVNGSDKFGNHFYTQHYDFHFKEFKNKRNKVLEIGVGGHSSPYFGGGSLRMWKQYFKRSQIYSIDIYAKELLQEKRIQIFKGSQTDAGFLEDLISKIGSPHIIIDDGSHLNEHVLTSFQILFKHVLPGGYYVVEDIQTSYWPEFGGSKNSFNEPNTIMGYFKSLADGLNHQEYLIPDYKPTYTDLNITAVHFYHNMIFIRKGFNDEKSNLVEKGVFKEELIIES